MSEEAIEQFCEITNQDRRTAIYCLQRHRGNLNLAISYYFDNQDRIIIPPDFMNPNNPSQSASNQSARTAENQSRQTRENLQTAAPPPANPMGQPTARIMRTTTIYQKEEPSIFIPFGLPNTERPSPFEDQQPKSKDLQTFDYNELFDFPNRQTEKCTVYTNGIFFQKNFYPNSDSKCQKAIDQITQNQIPTALDSKITDLNIDLEFVNDDFSKA